MSGCDVLRADCDGPDIDNASLSLVSAEAFECARSAQLEVGCDEGGVFLSDGQQVLRGDFSKLLQRVANGGAQRELAVKAAKIKGVESPFVVDATAGLGEDSFLFAAAGFRVLLFERNPVVAALLADSLHRAQVCDKPALSEIASRMNVIESDGAKGLSALSETPDVVYLDPMFAAKRSARAKKKLQLLQQLERPCSDDDGAALLEAAFAAGPRKIVVKRPLKGDWLAGRKPAYSLKGKFVRFDCYVIARSVS